MTIRKIPIFQTCLVKEQNNFKLHEKCKEQMSTLKKKDAHIIKDVKAFLLSMVRSEPLNTLETNKKVKVLIN